MNTSNNIKSNFRLKGPQTILAAGRLQKSPKFIANSFRYVFDLMNLILFLRNPENKTICHEPDDKITFNFRLKGPQIILATGRLEKSSKTIVNSFRYVFVSMNLMILIFILKIPDSKLFITKQIIRSSEILG